MRAYVKPVKNFCINSPVSFLISFFMIPNPTTIIETMSRLHYSYPYNYTHYIQYVTGAYQNIEMIPFNMLNINIMPKLHDESFLLPLQDVSSKYYIRIDKHITTQTKIKHIMPLILRLFTPAPNF